MKIFFSSRSFVAVLFLIIGGLIGGKLEHRQDAKNNPPPAAAVVPVAPPGLSIAQDSDKFFDDLFNDQFFKDSRQPFQEMQRQEKSLLQRYSQPELLQTNFNNWYKKKFGGGDMNDVVVREDSQRVYYDIALKGEMPKNLSIGVKDNQVVLSAPSTSTTAGGTAPASASGDASIAGQFARTFPTPANVDTAKYRVEKGTDMVVVSFPKKDARISGMNPGVQAP